MMSWKEFGKDLEGSGHIIIKTLLSIQLLQGKGKVPELN
jgi:hypothetical protein